MKKILIYLPLIIFIIMILALATDFNFIKNDFVRMALLILGALSVIGYLILEFVHYSKR